MSMRYGSIGLVSDVYYFAKLCDWHPLLQN